MSACECGGVRVDNAGVPKAAAAALWRGEGVFKSRRIYGAAAVPPAAGRRSRDASHRSPIKDHLVPP